ncbi:M20/M25/M40 family metallo-hydrolase, partial [Gilvimarinus sp. 1_MG-2023]
ELSWEEEHTARVVRQRLDDLGIRWRACARTGTVAWLGGSAAPASDTPHFALRGDMDALPIQEQTSVAWRSRQDGCMHACGHDGHS